MNRDFQFTWRKNIAGKMSFYRNIARQNRSADEGLKVIFRFTQVLLPSHQNEQILLEIPVLVSGL